MDIIDKLKVRHREEVADIDAYERLQKEAKEQGCHHLADVLGLVIKDEKSHRDFLAEYIKEWEKN